MTVPSTIDAATFLGKHLEAGDGGGGDPVVALDVGELAGAHGSIEDQLCRVRNRKIHESGFWRARWGDRGDAAQSRCEDKLNEVSAGQT